MSGESDDQVPAPIKVLQFICPTGYFGAEHWITTLINNTDPKYVVQSLVVTDESKGESELDLCVAVERLGAKVHKIPMANRFDVRAVFALKKLILHERIDVLHTHGYKSDIIGVLAAKLAGVACVCTPHGFENTKDIKLRMFISLGKFSFRFFDKVAPLSEPSARDVAKMGIKPERIRYIPNGVDLKDIDARIEQVIASRENESSSSKKTVRTLGYIGQLISRKNVGDLLTVFNTLARSDGSLRLLIVGDGDERGLLEEQASQSERVEKIEFRGFVSDAIPIYADIDIFLMSSTLEGIPRCLMESMALEVPIVAYDIAGVSDLLPHEQTGMLVPFGDTAKMVKIVNGCYQIPLCTRTWRRRLVVLCMSGTQLRAKLVVTRNFTRDCWRVVEGLLSPCSTHYADVTTLLTVQSTQPIMSNSYRGKPGCNPVFSISYLYRQMI